MKKKLTLIVTLFLLSGCAESLALLGPASSGAGSGKAIQSTFSSAVSFGVKHQTGKSPSQHALTYIKKHNPQKNKGGSFNKNKWYARTMGIWFFTSKKNYPFRELNISKF